MTKTFVNLDWNYLVNLNSIEICDLFSFAGAHQFVLATGVNTVIGENRDESGTNSNGSGKSSLLDSILFVLFGQTAKQTRISDVIRKGAKQAHAKLWFDVQGKRYLLQRTKTESTHTLELYENEQGSSLAKGVKETQKLLMILMGLPEEFSAKDFMRTNYFSKTAVYSFVTSDLGAEERIRLVCSALSMDRVATALKNAKYDGHQCTSGAEVLRKTINNMRGLLKDPVELDEKLVKVTIGLQTLQTNSFEKQQTQEVLSKYRDEMQGYLDIVGKYEMEARRIDLEISKAKNSMEVLAGKCAKAGAIELQRDELIKELSEFDIERDKQYRIEVVQSIKDLDDLVVQLRKEIHDLRNQERDLNQSKKGLVVCPACETKLTIANNNVLVYNESEVASRLKDTLAMLTIRLKREKELDSEREQFEINKEQVSQRILAAAALGSRILKLVLVDVDQLKQTIENIQVVIDDFELTLIEKKSEFELALPEKYKLWEWERFSTKVADCNGELKRLSFELREQQNELNVLEAERAWLIVKQQQNRDLLSGIEKSQNELADLSKKSATYILLVDLLSDFRRQLIMQFIPLFEIKANQYLVEMGFNFVVTMSMFRLKADDEFKPELNISVDSGSGARPFDTFSEGEKVRIALACQFALMDISGMRVLDLLMLDEVLDSLDDRGFESLIPVCSKLASKILVTSRMSAFQVATWSTTLTTVIKENGESRFL